MTFAEAKQKLWGGATMRREAWYEAASVHASHVDKSKKMQLVDESGREHGLSHADTNATDWIIIEEGNEACQT
jgi:hypothetical protein